MKKIQKSAITALSAMAMLLGSVPAAFADEAVISAAPAAQEVQAVNTAAPGIGTFASNPYPGYFDGGSTTDIYFNGPVTITFYARVQGFWNFKVYNQAGQLVNSVNSMFSFGNIQFTLPSLYGYHHIVATSPDGAGGSYNIHY